MSATSYRLSRSFWGKRAALCLKPNAFSDKDWKQRCRGADTAHPAFLRYFGRDCTKSVSSAESVALYYHYSERMLCALVPLTFALLYGDSVLSKSPKKDLTHGQEGSWIQWSKARRWSYTSILFIFCFKKKKAKQSQGWTPTPMKTVGFFLIMEVV